ncbi:transmembrane protein 216-like isoform X2 [Chrysoperla carnea]|uniref:transmembrane protein 216-like isoform X2 n=1 Tax=Chrysoperla carnea TaxID=189513 RepID=UPI001D0630E8|nr:transmembrane protein 216-like isoform X2 [Chrysoperla carnea]
MNTSLFYEVLLYLNSFYFGVFGVSEVGIALFKYVKIPYSKDAMLTEFSLLIFLCILEYCRIWLGRRGNFSDRVSAIPIILSTLLILPAAAIVVYFLIWQELILRFEYIILSVQLLLHATELVIAFLNIMPSSRKQVYD